MASAHELRYHQGSSSISINHSISSISSKFIKTRSQFYQSMVFQVDCQFTLSYILFLLLHLQMYVYYSICYIHYFRCCALKFLPLVHSQDSFNIKLARGRIIHLRQENQSTALEIMNIYCGWNNDYRRGNTAYETINWEHGRVDYEYKRQKIGLSQKFIPHNDLA